MHTCGMSSRGKRDCGERTDAGRRAGGWQVLSGFTPRWGWKIGATKTPSQAEISPVSIKNRLSTPLRASRSSPSENSIRDRNDWGFAQKAEVFIDDRRGKPAHMTVFYPPFP